jgi:hypothetical protein
MFSAWSQCLWEMFFAWLTLFISLASPMSGAKQHGNEQFPAEMPEVMADKISDPV